MRKAIISSEPIISRRITAYFRTTHKKIRSWIIQCYALTNGAEDDDKDNLYNLLRQVISKSEEKDVVIIMVDLDASYGSSSRGQVNRRWAVWDMNKNGERLADFCADFGRVIGGEFFPSKAHKLT